MEDLKSKAQAILTARELYDRTAELCHYNVYVELSRQYAADVAKWAMELEKEGLEQARLLGISGSVELKLLTKIASLEAKLKHVADGTVYCPSCGEKGVVKEDDGCPRRECSNGHSWMSASQQEKYWMRLVSSLEARLKVAVDGLLFVRQKRVKWMDAGHVCECKQALQSSTDHCKEALARIQQMESGESKAVGKGE